MSTDGAPIRLQHILKVGAAEGSCLCGSNGTKNMRMVLQEPHELRNTEVDSRLGLAACEAEVGERGHVKVSVDDVR